MRKFILLACAAASLAATSGLAAGKPEFGNSGLDLSTIDHTVRPGDDFWRYMNGGWEKTQTIPSDRSYWGDAARLRELSLNQVRGILDEAVKAPATADARKVGVLYAAYMDEAAVAAKGLAPLRPDLARIAAIKTPADLARVMARFEKNQPLTSQSMLPVSPGVDADLRDPTRHALYIGQGGLGLPDRDYYLSQDAKMAEARAAYRTYLVTLFTLIGQSGPQARADRVIALETALAQSHWARADRRDFTKIYNPMSPSEFANKAPGFDWATYLKAYGVGDRKRLLATNIVEHRREFLTAETADQIGAADRLPYRFGEHFEHLIADRMTEPIIDRLEMIHVHQQHRHRFRMAAMAFGEARGLLHERAPVRQPGQRIDHRRRFVPQFGAFLRHRQQDERDRNREQ